MRDWKHELVHISHVRSNFESGLLSTGARQQLATEMEALRKEARSAGQKKVAGAAYELKKALHRSC